MSHVLKSPLAVHYVTHTPHTYATHAAHLRHTHAALSWRISMDATHQHVMWCCNSQELETPFIPPALWQSLTAQLWYRQCVEACVWSWRVYGWGTVRGVEVWKDSASAEAKEAFIEPVTPIYLASSPLQAYFLWLQEV